MNKKKTFTLAEMVIVMAVLGIIIGLTRNLFNTSRQEKILFGETCANYIYGQFSNFVTDISYGRTTGINTSNTSYYQLHYTDSKIEMGSISSGTSTFLPIYSILLGTGIAKNTSSWCSSSKYSLASIGTTGMSTIAIPIKGQSLPSIGEKNIWFIGSDNFNTSLYTGSIEFYVCDKTVTNPNDTSCIGTAKILVDKRSQLFFLHKCLTRDKKTGKCLNRPTVF